MKKFIFTILLLITLGSCQQKDTTIKETSAEINQNTQISNKVTLANKIELNDFIGQYEFKNTYNLKESLFLILEKVDVKSINGFEGFSWEEKNEKGEVVIMTLKGLLYGNTDLFDEAREGYAPGFFVVNSQIEPYGNNNLKLSLNVEESDILENPVQFPIQSTEEALEKGNKKWEITTFNVSKDLFFEIKNTEELLLKSEYGEKILKKDND